MFRRSLLSAVLALPLAASAATQGGAATYEVEIRDFHFVPARVTVPAGARVTWTNKDEEPHTVTSTDNRFPSSPALDSGDRHQATFSRPGTYPYFCSIHPHMVGTIIVK